MIHSSEIWDPLRKKSVARTPEVELGQETVDQALRYNSVLDVKFITITNGRKTFMFRRGEAEALDLAAALISMLNSTMPLPA